MTVYLFFNLLFEFDRVLVVALFLRTQIAKLVMWCLFIQFISVLNVAVPLLW